MPAPGSAGRPGRAGTLRLPVTESCNRPPMAKVWPLPSSTVVSARRTVSDGMTIEVPLVDNGHRILAC